MFKTKKSVYGLLVAGVAMVTLFGFFYYHATEINKSVQSSVLAANGFPDLRIVDSWVEAQNQNTGAWERTNTPIAGQALIVGLEIQNTGTLANSNWSSVRIENRNLDGNVGSFSFQPLNPNETTIVRSNGLALYASTSALVNAGQAIWLNVDPSNSIAELNEMNNNAVINLNPIPAPDRSVDFIVKSTRQTGDAIYRRGAYEVSRGDHIVAEVRVYDNNHYLNGNTADLPVLFSSGEDYQATQNVSITGIENGFLNFDINTANLNSGEYEFSAQINPNREIAESNYDNNIYPHSFKIRVIDGQVVPEPAVNIAEISVDEVWAETFNAVTNQWERNDHPNSGDRIIVNANVSNSGNISAEVPVRAADLLKNNSIFTVLHDEELQPGETRQYRFPDFFILTSASGHHQISVKADAFDEIAEMDERNNTMVLDLNPAVPTMQDIDLIIQGFERQPIDMKNGAYYEINRGETLNLDVYVTNHNGFLIGRTIRNVEVTASDATGDTTRSIDMDSAVGAVSFSFDTSAWELGDHPINLYVNNAHAIRENNLTNNKFYKPVLIRVMNGEAPALPVRPDLMINEAWVETQNPMSGLWERNDHPLTGDIVKYAASIRNQGDAPISNFQARLSLGNEVNDITVENNLAVNSSMTIRFDQYPVMLPDTHYYHRFIVLDPSNRFQENDETNNQLRLDLTLEDHSRRTDIDLYVAGATEYPRTVLGNSQRQVYKGQIYPLQVTLRDNNYERWANAEQVDANIPVRLEIDGQNYSQVNRTDVVEGIGTTIFEIDTNRLSLGEHTVRLTADFGNVLAETNENNNNYMRSYSFTVLNPNLHVVAGQNAYSNIVVSNVQTTPENPQVGDSVTLRATIQNTSSVATGRFDVDLFDRERADINSIDRTPKRTVQSMEPNASVEVVFDNYPVTVTKIGHRIDVVADFYQVVDETGELDNFYTLLIGQVAAPPVVKVVPVVNTFGVAPITLDVTPKAGDTKLKGKYDKTKYAGLVTVKAYVNGKESASSSSSNGSFTISLKKKLVTNDKVQLEVITKNKKLKVKSEVFKIKSAKTIKSIK